MKILKYIYFFCLFVFLTYLTQIGGLVLILTILLFYFYFNQKILNVKYLLLSKILVFFIIYSLFTFFIVPPIAARFGRVPLTMLGEKHIKPVNAFVCLLNRNYVRPKLKLALESVADKLNEQYEGTEIRYLDANFPFFNSFPLLPHLSHNDGRKLDVALFYVKHDTQKPSNEKPSWSGYGVNESPRKGDRNRCAECLQKGYWQYDYAKYLTFGSQRTDFDFDEARTKTMTELFAAESNIEKMFLEPHLQSRLHLESLSKIHLHGCQAVRHDDHLHVQIY